MTILQLLDSAEQKITWFIANPSKAQYAISELAEALATVRKVRETVRTVLPQVEDLMEGRATLVYKQK